jgi:hypothetical protein
VFTAVVATGNTTGWAFGGQFSTLSADTAWRLSGATWTRDKTFPGKNNETAVTAGANSPSDVWAFASQLNGSLQDEGGPTVILHFNGAISVVSVSRIPGSAAQLASGATFKVAQPGVNQVAVILRYS